MARVEVFEELDSTNEEAKRRALAGEAGPVWLVAKRQTAGRGRRGRAWTSDTGNLFTTGLFQLDSGPARAAQLSFAAALAVGDLAASAVDPSHVALKWPNDVLIKGRKVCGILLESGAHPNGGLWLAVGIGVNLAHHPDDTERRATSFKAHGADLSPELAAEHLAERFEYWLTVWDRDGFAFVREAWLARAWGLGDVCTARLADETVEGVFADLGADGSLRLDLKDGTRRFISAGDVFFPNS